MELPEANGTPPAGRAWFRPVVVAGAVLALVLAGLGVAAAQSTDTTTDPGSAGTTAPAEDAPGRPFRHKGFGPKGFGFGGFHRGAIHGEVTVPGRDGGYQTLATQVGEVTAVSPSEIAVRSEDGFARSYRVDDDTLVNAGRDGIGDVKTGDTVRVVAVVDGDERRAVRVVDTTNVERSLERWRPGRR